MPVAVAPGTWLQSRMSPEKIAWIVACDRFATGFFGFVARQIASRAILLKMPPGSLDLGSRDELPIVTPTGGDISHTHVRACPGPA